MVNFHLHLGNILKGLRKGNIVKVYSKMYSLAENLASRETEKYLTESLSKIEVSQVGGDKWDNEALIKFVNNIWNFHNDRINHHMDEMKKLLVMSSKANVKEEG